MADPANRTALVTGASGMIGRRLCQRLRDDGWRVLGTSRRDPGPGPWARYAAADLSAAAATETLARAFAGETVHALWHIAAKAHAHGELRQDPDEYARSIVAGTAQALALAERLGARRFVLASSVAAMGRSDSAVLDETSPCAPDAPYGRSKLEAERLTRAARNLEAVVLRFCLVYGPHDPGNMARMIAAVRRGWFPPFPETGNRRSVLHVDDAVQACVLAATVPGAAGETFVVTDGRLYSTRELYLAVRAALGLNPPRITPPLWLFRAAARAGDGLEWLLRRRMPLDTNALAKLSESAAYSSAKASRMLGYAPDWPLARGLAEMTRSEAEKNGPG